MSKPGREPDSSHWGLASATYPTCSRVWGRAILGCMLVVMVVLFCLLTAGHDFVVVLAVRIVGKYMSYK